MKPYLCGLLWILRLFSVIIFSIDQGIFLKIENVHGNIIKHNLYLLPYFHNSQFASLEEQNKRKKEKIIHWLEVVGFIGRTAAIKVKLIQYLFFACLYIFN